MVTSSVPCGADHKVPPPALCVGPGSVTVSVNDPCGGMVLPCASLQFWLVEHMTYAPALPTRYCAPKPGAASALANVPAVSVVCPDSVTAKSNAEPSVTVTATPELPDAIAPCAM